MKRSLKLGVALALTGGIAAAATFGPLVRSLAEAQARARGVELSIEQVRPGRGAVWLRGVVVRVPAVPALSGRLDAVEVVLEGTRPRRVVVHGGSLALEGTLDELLRQLADFRAARATAAAGGAGGGSGVTLEARGLTLTATVPLPADPRGGGAGPGGAPVQHAWGLAYARDGERERISVDLARATLPGLRGELRGLEIDLARAEGGRRLDAVRTAGGELEVDPALLVETLGRLRAARAGSAPTAAAPPGAPEPVGTGSGAAAASAAAPGAAPGAAGSAPGQPPGPATVPASPSPPAGPGAAGAAPPRSLAQRLDELLPRSPDRGARWRGRLAELAARAELALPAGARFALGDLTLRLVGEGTRLSVGPARVALERTADRVRFELAPGGAAPGGTPLALSVELPLGPQPVTVGLRGGPVSLAELGVKEGELGLTAVDRARVEADGTLRLSGDGAEVELSGRLGVAELSLRRDWLSAGTVSGLGLVLRGNARAATDGAWVELRGLEIAAGEARARLDLDLRREAQHFTLRAAGGVPLASCEALLAALPRGLSPLIDGLGAAGTFALDGELALDTRDLGALRQRWQVQNGCRMTALSEEVSPTRFARAWKREVLDAAGRAVTLESGPGTPGWVPYHALSPHLETALLICEDAAFRRHGGFDQEAIENSLRMNLEAGRFVRGASTLSMQLAKNLYLSREKTVTRKLQEALLTLLLEQTLGKERILELYLNVVEFGPGVYGIGPAARHYFATDAGSLSLPQALYLASVLPSPRRHHFGADGRVTAGWMGYLRKLVRVAERIHRITPGELDAALAEELAFRVPSLPGKPADGQDPAPGEPPGAGVDGAPLPPDGEGADPPFDDGAGTGL